MRILLLGSVLALAFLSYVNTFPNDFVWDDQGLILENQNVQASWGFPQFFTGSIASGTNRQSPYYRPLYMLSFWLDCQLWGLKPWGFHLTNILLHLVNTLLVFILMTHLSIRTWTAFFTAAFFAVHPAQTEAVASISGRGWPLVTFFLLTALLFFISYREQSKAQTPPEKESHVTLFLSLFFFLLSLLTMEIAMIFPFLFLLYDGFNSLRLRERKIAETLRPHTLFWVLLAAFCLLRVTLLRFSWFSTGSDLHLDRRILTAPMIFFSYLGILLFPVTLRLERTVPFARSLGDPLALAAWLGALAFAALLIFLIRRRRAPLFVFGCLWMTAALMPALNIIPLRAMMAEAWLYLPTLGFSIALGSLVVKAIERFRRLGWVLAASLIAFFVLRTVTRNQDWRDGVTLYEASVRDSPSSVKMQYNLGTAYAQVGRYEDAKREFENIGASRERYMRDFNRNFYSD